MNSATAILADPAADAAAERKPIEVDFDCGPISMPGETDPIGHLGDAGKLMLTLELIFRSSYQDGIDLNGEDCDAVYKTIVCARRALKYGLALVERDLSEPYYRGWQEARRQLSGQYDEGVRAGIKRVFDHLGGQDKALAENARAAFNRALPQFTPPR